MVLKEKLMAEPSFIVAKLQQQLLSDDFQHQAIVSSCKTAHYIQADPKRSQLDNTTESSGHSAGPRVKKSSRPKGQKMKCRLKGQEIS